MAEEKEKTPCSWIDGIGSSSAIDTSSEIIDISGLDCSSLIGGPFTWEHKNDQPNQLVGKILEYKKIFSDKDCENDRHKYYWNKCKTPFLYVMGRLFDDKKDSSKECAALFLDDAEHPNEHPMVGFSVEGSKISKNGMIVDKSIARKITITNCPANKTCVAELIPGPESKESAEDSIFKSEPSHTIELFGKSEELKKAEPMKKSLPWSAGKQKGNAMHFTHPEHGTVSVTKEDDSFHVKHNGAPAGLKGNKGVFSNPQDAGSHAKAYMGAVSNGQISSHKMHDRSSPQMAGMGKAEVPGSKYPSSAAAKGKAPALTIGPPKFGPIAPKVSMAPKKAPGGPQLAKAMSAGSGMAGPGTLTGGAALGKEELDKKMKKADRLNEPVFSGVPGKELKAWNPGIKSGIGQSNMGAHVRNQSNPKSSDSSKETSKVRAKQIAEKNLKRLKDAPKPDLGKGEDPLNPIAGNRIKRASGYKQQGDKLGHTIAMEGAKDAHKERLQSIKSAPKPKLDKSELLQRAEQEYSQWSKREEFENFMAKAMPNLTKSEIQVIGQTICLRKSLKAEKALKKMVTDQGQDSWIEKKEK